MKKIFLNDEPNLEIFLRRNSNSRRISLRISALDGKITLTGPRNLNLEEFKKFAESKKSWLKSTINSFDTPIFVSEGAKIPILGDIPLLGALFRGTSETVSKQNLMVFIKPTIIDDLDVADQRTKEKYKLIQRQQIEGISNEEIATLPEIEGL